MMKICIINHTFQKPQFCKRWQLLAEKFKDVDVTLLAPSDWTWGGDKGLTYGTVEVLKGEAVEKDNFRVHLIDIRKRPHGEWTSKGLEREIAAIRPDCVYYIGGHNNLALMDIYKIRRKYRLKNTKIMVFSMRGHTHGLALQKSKSPLRQLKYLIKYFIFRSRLKKMNKHTDAVFCHFPVAMSEFRREGYKGPIYMQTQVGVDIDIFHPDREARARIREKYNIGDAYLFGSASRFNADKGLSEIIAALPAEGNWKYLMMGWGRDDEVEKLKREIAERGLEDKIILTGYIDNWPDMAAHWNALDCAVHAPLTSEIWEETFSLALVQAMATGLPVIGSSSGSVPYQIGPEGIILPERDIDAMRRQFERMLSDRAYGEEIGRKMYKRAVSCFDIRHLNDCFYHSIKDVVAGIYDEAKIDMAEYLVEE